MITKEEFIKQFLENISLNIFEDMQLLYTDKEYIIKFYGNEMFSVLQLFLMSTMREGK